MTGEVVHGCPRILFEPSRVRRLRCQQLKTDLERGYKESAKRDRELANEWAALAEAWPEA